MTTGMSALSASTAFVGRQPIFSKDLQVFAYELLYRDGCCNHANILNEDAATAQVMLDTLLEIGLQQVVGRQLAFINMTRNFLLEGYALALPKEEVVLEILENIEPDSAVIHALSELSEKGYTLALDDFVYNDSLQALIDIADVIKIDILSLPSATIKEHVRILRRFPVKLLAEKVETHEDFDFCQSLGFDYFQGNFFCLPKLVSGKRLPPNRMTLLMILAKIQDPDIYISGLEDIIKQDLALSYKILRLVNSAFFSLPRKVDSIGQAAGLIGTDRIRIWASLLALVSMEGKPHELLVIALTRACMCKQLGELMHHNSIEGFYTVGLFSILDSFLDCGMDDIVGSLPLSQEVSKALLDYEGPMGQALQCVKAYEQGDWEAVLCGKLEPFMIRDCYLSAIDKASTMMKNMGVS